MCVRGEAVPYRPPPVTSRIRLRPNKLWPTTGTRLWKIQNVFVELLRLGSPDVTVRISVRLDRIPSRSDVADLLRCLFGDRNLIAVNIPPAG